MTFRCESEEGKKWHYDSVEGICTSFDYLGCFGTDNVFDDEESCNNICVKSEPDAAGSGGVVRPRLGEGDGVCDNQKNDDNCTTTPDNKV